MKLRAYRQESCNPFDLFWTASSRKASVIYVIFPGKNFKIAMLIKFSPIKSISSFMAYTFQATTFSPSGFVSHKISKTKLITNYNDKMLLPITKILLVTCNLRQIYQPITTAINHKL